MTAEGGADRRVLLINTARCFAPKKPTTARMGPFRISLTVRYCADYKPCTRLQTLRTSDCLSAPAWFSAGRGHGIIHLCDLSLLHFQICSLCWSVVTVGDACVASI